MRNRADQICYTGVACLLYSFGVLADQEVDATRLTYNETEQGTDPYVVKFTVTKEFIRIDDESDTSGFIVYDIKQNRIFSVSNYDRSILVIPEYAYTAFEPAFEVDIEHTALEDAPTISGKKVYNYVVRANTSVTSETCMRIQLVQGLMPEVAKSLQAFQRLVSGQHAANVEKTPEEFRTPCYLVDQVYNRGDYYDKGFPIQEWHSNERTRQLVNFEDVKVDASVFDIPPDYRQYSLGEAGD